MARKATKARQAKSKKFPICLGKGNRKPDFDEWFANVSKGRRVATDDDYECFYEMYGERTYYTKDGSNDTVFNLEEWCDPWSFEPEEKCDIRPFRTIDRKSYKVAIQCDTWYKEWCYTDYVGNGTFYLLEDSGFYDDLEKISNAYVKRRIRMAFNSFLESLCNSLDGIGNENENWTGE